jgi:hypothetical protein
MSDGTKAPGEPSIVGEALQMRSRGMIRFLWILTAATAVTSAYGWWFHFSVGPAHGAGLQLGVVAGLLSVGMLLLTLRFSRRPGGG